MTTHKMEIEAVNLDAFKEQVEQEIRDHDKWCGEDCQTFLPTCYREARILRGRSAESLQRNYDSCHIFR